MGHPVLQLAGDLPVQPSLLGNLVPQQINLWAGCAPEGELPGHAPRCASAWAAAARCKQAQSACVGLWLHALRRPVGCHPPTTSITTTPSPSRNHHHHHPPNPPPAGSSTGLHHDYHDNVYILLRGRKRFRLYPPSDAQRMYVRGELRAVHPNGRIVYKSQVGVLCACMHACMLIRRSMQIKHELSVPCPT